MDSATKNELDELHGLARSLARQEGLAKLARIELTRQIHELDVANTSMAERLDVLEERSRRICQRGTRYGRGGQEPD